MKQKKNPKADLNRNSGLYFFIGLTLVLFTTWRALEHKSYDTSLNELVIAHTIDAELLEEVPITEAMKPPPPPAAPSAPVVIEIVEDEVEIEETVIQSSEMNQDTEISNIVAVDDIEVGELEEEVTVPFSVIEEIPVFPGCEQGTKAEKMACFQQKVQEHVRKNFRYPEIAVEMGIQGKVYVQFVIDTKGRITNIRKRGPDILLEKEAERIIALLPRMIPGKQRGRAVKVPYSIPVSFKLM
ncbi:MAG: energy transducer TonB [Maribacter sp.]